MALEPGCARSLTSPSGRTGCSRSPAISGRPGCATEPAPFVGSRRCGECHRRIYREQQRESRHAQTLRFAGDLKDVPLPADPVPDPVIPVSPTVSHERATTVSSSSQRLDRVFRAMSNTRSGSGRHGITMLAKDEEGIDRELRISYFGQDQSWGQTKGIDFAPRDAGDHIGMGLGRKRSTTVSPVTRRGFARSARPGRALEAPKAKTTASAASDVMDQGLTTARRRSPASRNWRSRCPRRRRRRSV